MLRTLWIQNPTVSYRSAFAVGGSPPSQETSKKIVYSGYAGGPTIFLLPPIWERGIKISRFAKFVCPTSQLLKRPVKSAFKRLILTMTTPLCQHLLLTTSTNPTSVELNDSECEKGQIRSLIDPLSSMQLLRAVYLWWLLDKLLMLRWRRWKDSTSKLS